MESAQAFSVDRYYEFARQSGAEITTIGFSEQGRPIQVLKKGSGNLKVLFIARIHGNEPATTQALLEFFQENSFNGIKL
ncbi:MAG TPA: M14 family zinc carboxypeptidase, partial [Ignavibacteriales bacterium]|nr:M14 family zinc carboxypeptidase [Ignavibacteriales bacterium]